MQWVKQGLVLQTALVNSCQTLLSCYQSAVIWEYATWLGSQNGNYIFIYREPSATQNTFN